MADGEAFAIDRSTDSGDASLLILGAVNVGMGGAGLAARAASPGHTSGLTGPSDQTVSSR
ncbi:hypothetical protein [Micromonospora arida]|uniref:hypothetical protein n=1 Tax=Micromonospora arida TaxID=2203715 RepID=UPI003CEBAD50